MPTSSSTATPHPEEGGDDKPGRLSDWLVNGLLVTVSIALAWTVAELAFSFVGLRYVPLRFHADLPENIRVFAQSAKDGVVPRDPIVLLGDSYAQGYGDWLLQANPNSNGAFNSGHIIHDLTRRDVVTFGQAGAGSAEGIAALPAMAYARTASAWHLRLPQPSLLVIYFYEGNDLNNNMSFLRTRVDSRRESDIVVRIDNAIAGYPAALTHPQASGDSLPLFGFLRRLALRLYTELKGLGETPVETGNASAQVELPNLVEVGGKPLALPAGLQSPALELTQVELERAALVFERSLAFVRKLFPQAPVLVVDVPSPLSSYELVGEEVSVQRYLAEGPARYPRERVTQYSDAICELIRAASIGQGAGFVDLRPAIRAASSQGLVHGPRDFKHFNREGMTVLGQVVAEQVKRPLTQGLCAKSFW